MTDAEREELDREWLEGISSFETYAKRYLKIQTTEGQLINFQFNPVQKLLDDIESHITAQGRLIRCVILKARREGVSTRTTAKYFYKVANNFNRYAALVTHEPEATDFIFKMQKRYYDHLPREFKPQTKYNNTKMLEFNNKTGTGLDSAIRVWTAGKDDAGSGQLIHYLHLSEVPKWPANTQRDLLISLLPCVPSEPDTSIIFEATAKGIGGEFYSRFWACRYRYEIYLDSSGLPAYRCVVNEDADPNNEYSSIFVPWFVFEKYQAEVPTGFQRTADETALASVHGLTDRHLQWRRQTIENICGGSVDLFKQDYPSTPDEAFLASGRPVFDNAKLLILKNACKLPAARYECALSTGHFVAQPDGRLKVWQESQRDRAYVISIDVAEGIRQGDFSVIDVIDQLSGVQCAQWHGHIDPDQLAVLAAHIGRRYNTAWIVPERNNHGFTTVMRLSDMKYPYLYAEMIPEPPGKPRKRFGWLTNRKTKPEVIDNLISEIRDGTHGIQCAETFTEMMTFQVMDDGSQEAAEGMYDDRVMSLAIAKFVRLRLPKTVPVSTGQYDISNPFTGASRQIVQDMPTNAWT